MNADEERDRAARVDFIRATAHELFVRRRISPELAWELARQMWESKPKDC